MDLLDFEAQELYFQQAELPEVQALIAQAAEYYADGRAELPLLQAYLRAPESFNVLVALNRFYYYQHRLAEALLTTEKALALIQCQLKWPDWRQVTLTHLVQAPPEQLTQVRFYLFALKSVGFLNMRLENLALSQEIFTQLSALDDKDRLGVRALLTLVIERQVQCTV